MESYKRPSKNEYYLNIALAVSKRSTCLKRHYGAVIINNDEIIATGYNGSPRNTCNCCDTGECARLSLPSNTGDYAQCHSVHAEQNALLSASRNELNGAVMYLAGEEFDKDIYEKEHRYVYKKIDDCSPCPVCQRMIENAGIKLVIGKNDE